MAQHSHHAMLSNTYVLLSIFAVMLAFVVWSLSPSWGFLLLLVGIIVFIATFISAVRAPLLSDEEMELAVHEKYHGRRYPDTHLHHGHVPKTKKVVHTRHKKVLVKHASGAAKKRRTKKKSSRKRAAKKK
ncbi:hypothetical protein GF367_04675 [Candidatus Woesearchaeota archaeon]|nr:hypothetical protein [Candidatus Woesearchaeota archaeon]